ncbi:siderophore-interacting protein [Nesterenkonia aerolata]|uniref:Siderophore-interacting protein n=1 Tax=Nesterenkonia aerolata TaxID=3074079 RepID=A0ABU2DNF4_9MICC|nr:siderophore-interacting protein [Nesterenkonia sp. LY-0111]MDR8018047.1 siderophore-interacting protein [Nesterenkonia sp. LY-0111]
MADAAKPPRKPRVQHVLEVQDAYQLTPHLRRVVLGGQGFDAIEFKDATDQYIKLLFADPALGLERPFDLEALRQQLPQKDMPVTRTYTIRHIDRDARQLWVDMVVHGDEGLAGPWAQRVEPGEPISFFGPGGGYAPRPEADFHLLAGDESALPAIAAALESLNQHTPQARGVALIEVHDAEEEISLQAPEGIEIRWLHRGGPFSPQRARLVDELSAMTIPDGDVQAFIHGERGEMKRLRRLLVKERGMDRKAMSLSAYWAAGRIEDEFQAEKRTPVGAIDED